MHTTSSVWTVCRHAHPARLVKFVSQLVSGIAAATTLIAAPAEAAKSAVLTAPDAGRLVVDFQGSPAPAPLFFSFTSDQTLRIGQNEGTGEARLRLHVVQGKPEVFTLALAGEGDVLSVTGKALRDWAVRQLPSGQHLLDIRPAAVPVGTPPPSDYEFTVRTRIKKPSIPGKLSVLFVTSGDAVASSSTLTITSDGSVDLRVVSTTGVVPVDAGSADLQMLKFITSGEGRIEIGVAQRGTASAELELLAAQLAGQYTEGSRAVEFRLKGQLKVAKADSRVRLLTGRAGLTERAATNDWHVEVVSLGDGLFGYDLVGDKVGASPLELVFAAEVKEEGDWRTLNFFMPAGSIVPVTIDGLARDVSFKKDALIVPSLTPQGWQGFLPANGAVSLAWRKNRESEEGALFFTSSEQTDIRVGAGLVRASAHVALRVLQGKLNKLRFRLEGRGEIANVDGGAVVGWKVIPEGEVRVLEIQFSRPIEDDGEITIHSQGELGGFPARVEPLRLVPEGVVRHSGLVRIANAGAVRLELADVTGMMQLAPGQFAGGQNEEDLNQVFVYRFPSSAYRYAVLASQIQPEVSVSQIATYEIGETDRILSASIELDIREAALRDWTLQIPEDYTVVSASGAKVADYVAESAAANGYRALKIVFAEEVEGRQLLELRLEKNQPPAAGNWRLPPLRYPSAKTVRGHVGVVAVAGYRAAPSQTEHLVEVPLSYFPTQLPRLQQAWRLREPNWTAEVKVEALGQSVQVDAFHLYTVKQGVVFGSVLFNYFVVGAPATEWRIHVPATLGNVDVVGQNVRRDWRREGDQLIVSLHQPVLGPATLLLTFELPLSARGGTIQPGQVWPLNVQAERGYVQVASPMQVKHDVRRAEGGLLKLEALELPAEFRVLSSSQSLAVYQYTARPFDLEMGLEWYTPGETIDQLVDFARLSSQVSRDGQVVTHAQYFVKTRGRKALRLVLPAGVKLWEARVDNEITTARVDGEQTLIPLPAKLNPNEPVSVVLRLGQSAEGDGTRVKLAAPRMIAPAVISEWTLRSDPGRLLAPRGGNGEVVRPSLTETGFEWISVRGRVAVCALLLCTALAALCLRVPYGWRMIAGVLLCAVAMALAGLSMGEARTHRRANESEITYSASLVPANETLTVELANLPAARAMVVTWGLGAAAVGLLLLGVGWARRPRATAEDATGARIFGTAVPIAGLALITAGLLAQHGSAPLFFAALAIAVLILMVLPGVLRWHRDRTAPVDTPPDAPSAGGMGNVVSCLAMTALLGIGALFGAGKLSAQLPYVSSTKPWIEEGTKPAQSIVQSWSIREKRLYGEVQISVRGTAGDSVLLLRAPSMLTEFKADGLRVNKHTRDGYSSYYVTPERDGLVTGTARFEMPLEDFPRAIRLPTGPAATQRVTIELDEPGWAFTSSSAVQVTPTANLDPKKSGATLVLAPGGVATIQLQAKSRNVASEATQFFAETANLFVPGPGAISAYVHVNVRPVQGRVSELQFEVPAGFTVGEVQGPVGTWRFDPVKRRLTAAVEPAQEAPFSVAVEMQLGTGALPFDASLQPLRVLGAAGEVGMVALAFGPDAQPEAVRPTDLSPVNVEDFDATLLPKVTDEEDAPTLQHAWRYGQTGGRVELKIAPVEPEVRVATRQVVSIDDDRLVMAVDVHATITRAGVFKLSAVLPEGLEVEALSGSALSHWTEAQDGQKRVVTLHLNGRTVGEQTFSVTLAGAAPRSQASWNVPRFALREATRQTGELLIVPGRGLQLRSVQREKVTQLDPRSVGGMQPGTLAFRLLQDDWSLQLGIETLEAWTTVQALQEVTLREGQTLTRLALRYRVENAAIKHVQVKLPGISDERARTVRATGAAVSDIVRVAGQPDVWEIRFQRGIIGDTDVQIEFQGPASREQDRETIAPPEFPGARQVTQFVAVRTGGRLEIEAPELPRGWTRLDWNGIPTVLQNRSDRSVPAQSYRVAEPEAPLAVAVKRHAVAEALKLRVTQGDLTTLVSPRGDFLTTVELKVDVLEKGTLRVRLPEGARLFNTFVNGDSTVVMREGDAYLFNVAPASEANRNSLVRLTYGVTAKGRSGVGLMGPSLSVPLENVSWRVIVPPGYNLDDYSGALRLQQQYSGSWYSVDQYRSVAETRRAASAKKAVELLQEANGYLQRGDQQKAGEVLSRAAVAQGLDEASNEDARVQLRKLKTDQTVLGLTTRRQRLYLDNRVDTARNEQLEQAANLNPFMQGKLNFDPQQMDQLLMGNTVEENTALKGIAARLVDQQLVAEPAPGAIDVTLPERGKVFTFTRSLQVDGSAPLELKLTLQRVAGASWSFGLLVVAGVAAIAALIATWRRVGV